MMHLPYCQPLGASPRFSGEPGAQAIVGGGGESRGWHRLKGGVAKQQEASPGAFSAKRGWFFLKAAPEWLFVPAAHDRFAEVPPPTNDRAGELDANAFRLIHRRIICAARVNPGCRKQNAISTPNRNGLSLLEVIISVAIFLGALTAIMEGLSIGQRAEVAARLQSEAVLRCEAKMGEIICGAVEAKSSQGNTFDDDETGDWMWEAQVTDTGVSGLLEVTVLVEHSTGGEIPNAAFSLVRLMRDPQLFLDAALQESE